MRRALVFVAGGFVLLVLSGCPVSDHYYIDSGHKLPGSAADSSGAGASTGGTDALPQGGKADAGTSAAQAGSPAAGSVACSNPSGGSATAGTTGVVTAGSPDIAGAPAAGGSEIGAGGAAPCVPSTERCNGHDDDCDDLVDELVCNSNQTGTTGCTGFVLSPGANHGYMLCTGNPKDWTHAGTACEAQDMRLAWLESADENTGVAATIKKLTNETEILVGADDQAREGHWVWDGGEQFWSGNQFGMAVNGAFTSWTPGAPDNINNNEDCATLNPSTGTWSDRNCFATYAYLCEDKTP